jgi:Ribbon-helix-helix protein, copG family
MKRVNIYLTDQEITALQQLSQATGLKVAELVRRLLDEGITLWLERQRKQ